MPRLPSSGPPTTPTSNPNSAPIPDSAEELDSTHVYEAGAHAIPPLLVTREATSTSNAPASFRWAVLCLIPFTPFAGHFFKNALSSLELFLLDDPYLHMNSTMVRGSEERRTSPVALSQSVDLPL